MPVVPNVRDISNQQCRDLFSESLRRRQRGHHHKGNTRLVATQAMASGEVDRLAGVWSKIHLTYQKEMATLTLHFWVLACEKRLRCVHQIESVRCLDILRV